ncbi:hypothetical protein [Neisseria musculi]|uniref:hypothetical protein n=1 Tax=Neisseria musculi TaxID=1815583 RepID=UPI00164B7A0B|nr:hypothetical protein [Neisseria musculi]
MRRAAENGNNGGRRVGGCGRLKRPAVIGRLPWRNEPPRCQHLFQAVCMPDPAQARIAVSMEKV